MFWGTRRRNRKKEVAIRCASKWIAAERKCDARTGYCNSKPQDLLAGNSTEKDLETRAALAQAGNVSASMQLPYFYTAPNVARVNVAMEIATDNVKFDKQKGKFHCHHQCSGLGISSGRIGGRTLQRLHEARLRR